MFKRRYSFDGLGRVGDADDDGDEMSRREVQWLRGFQGTCDLGPDGVELGTKQYYVRPYGVHTHT